MSKIDNEIFAHTFWAWEIFNVQVFSLAAILIANARTIFDDSLDGLSGFDHCPGIFTVPNG